MHREGKINVYSEEVTSEHKNYGQRKISQSTCLHVASSNLQKAEKGNIKLYWSSYVIYMKLSAHGTECNKSFCQIFVKLEYL